MITEEFKLRCIRPVARHEAGHWLAAYLFNWKPREMAILVPEAENKHHSYAMTSYAVKLETIEDVREYARKRIVILYSGMFASGFNGSYFDMDKIKRETEPDGGSYSDFWKAEEIFFFYYNTLKAPKSWNEEFSVIFDEVERIIIENNQFLDEISSIICEQSHTVGQLIELTHDDLDMIYKRVKTA